VAVPSHHSGANDYGYFVSGPVKKDKLFFWWNEEWNKDNRGKPGDNLACPLPPNVKGDFSADVAAAIASLNKGGTAAATEQHYVQCTASSNIHQQWNRRQSQTTQPHPEFRWLPGSQAIRTPSPTRTPWANFWLPIIRRLILRLLNYVVTGRFGHQLSD